MYRILLGCIALVCLTAPVWAAGTPLQYTQSTLEQARAIVDSDQTHNEKLAALSVLMKNFLDTDTMGRAALDKNWAKLTPAQQKEFLTLFRELFQRTYVQKLLLFDKPNFGYVGEERVGPAFLALKKLADGHERLLGDRQERLISENQRVVNRAREPLLEFLDQRACPRIGLCGRFRGGLGGRWRLRRGRSSGGRR